MLSFQINDIPSGVYCLFNFDKNLLILSGCETTIFVFSI